MTVPATVSNCFSVSRLNMAQ